MFDFKAPEYNSRDLRSIINTIIEELMAYGDYTYAFPDENASEEELKTLYNKVRHRFLMRAVYYFYDYVCQFPFDDLFTDEVSMLKYLLDYFERIYKPLKKP
jgi:hypothetical protein